MNRVLAVPQQSPLHTKSLPYDVRLPYRDTVGGRTLIDPRVLGIIVVHHAWASHHELLEAIRDLGDVTLEAEEEGYRLPSDTAISNARVALGMMYRIHARRYEVYPMPDGEVAVDAPERGSSVMVICDSEGGIRYLQNVKGKQEYVCYRSLQSLPGSRLKEGLEAIRSG